MYLYLYLREFVLTTVILPPGVGYLLLGPVLFSWMRFRLTGDHPLHPVENSGTLNLKHPSRSFGTFGRKMGTHFDPNP